jgi:hypothetical protein
LLSRFVLTRKGIETATDLQMQIFQKQSGRAGDNGDEKLKTRHRKARGLTVNGIRRCGAAARPRRQRRRNSEPNKRAGARQEPNIPASNLTPVSWNVPGNLTTVSWNLPNNCPLSHAESATEPWLAGA